MALKIIRSNRIYIDTKKEAPKLVIPAANESARPAAAVKAEHQKKPEQEKQKKEAEKPKKEVEKPKKRGLLSKILKK